MAGRVAYRCSIPFCRRATIGPHTETDKTTLIGIAAHITAASPGGPRYDPGLTDIQRKSIDNGIWLCCTCATIVDKDAKAYPVPYLKKLRADAEEYSAHQMMGIKENFMRRPKIEAMLIYQSGMSSNEGFAEYVPHNSLLLMEEMQLIISAERYYKLLLINQSSTSAINVSLQQIGSAQLILKEDIPLVNNMGPFLEKTINCTLSSFYIMTGEERTASQREERAYPEELSELRFSINYTDEYGHQFQTLTSFNGKQPNNIFQ